MGQKHRRRWPWLCDEDMDLLRALPDDMADTFEATLRRMHDDGQHDVLNRAHPVSLDEERIDRGLGVANGRKLPTLAPAP